MEFPHVGLLPTSAVVLNDSSEFESKLDNVADRIGKWANNSESSVDEGRVLGRELLESFGTLENLAEYLISAGPKYNSVSPGMYLVKAGRNQRALGRALFLACNDAQRLSLKLILCQSVSPFSADERLRTVGPLKILHGLLPAHEYIETLQSTLSDNNEQVHQYVASYLIATLKKVTPNSDEEATRKDLLEGTVPFLSPNAMLWLNTECSSEETLLPLHGAVCLSASEAQWTTLLAGSPDCLLSVLSQPGLAIFSSYENRLADVVRSMISLNTDLSTDEAQQIFDRINWCTAAIGTKVPGVPYPSAALGAWNVACDWILQRKDWKEALSKSMCLATPSGCHYWQMRSLVNMLGPNRISQVLASTDSPLDQKALSYLLAVAAESFDQARFEETLHDAALSSAQLGAYVGGACLVAAVANAETATIIKILRAARVCLEPEDYIRFSDIVIQSVIVCVNRAEPNQVLSMCRLVANIVDECTDDEWSLLHPLREQSSPPDRYLCAALASTKRYETAVEWAQQLPVTVNVSDSIEFTHLCNRAMLLNPTQGEKFIEMVLKKGIVTKTLSTILLGCDETTSAAVIKHLSDDNFAKAAGAFNVLYSPNGLFSVGAIMDARTFAEEVARAPIRYALFFSLAETMSSSKFAMVLKALHMTSADARGLYRELFNRWGVERRTPTASMIYKLHSAWRQDPNLRGRSNEDTLAMARLLRLGYQNTETFKQFASHFMSLKFGQEWRNTLPQGSLGQCDLTVVGLAAADAEFRAQRRNELMELPRKHLALAMPFIADSLDESQLTALTIKYGLSFWADGLIDSLRKDQRATLDTIARVNLDSQLDVQSVEPYVNARLHYVRNLGGTPSPLLHALWNGVQALKKTRTASRVSDDSCESILDDELPMSLQGTPVSRMEYLRGSQGDCRFEVLQDTLSTLGLDDQLLEANGLTRMTAYYILFHAVEDSIRIIADEDKSAYKATLAEAIQAFLNMRDLRSASAVLEYMKAFK